MIVYEKDFYKKLGLAIFFNGIRLKNCSFVLFAGAKSTKNALFQGGLRRSTNLFAPLRSVSLQTV